MIGNVWNLLITSYDNWRRALVGRGYIWSANYLKEQCSQRSWWADEKIERRRSRGPPQEYLLLAECVLILNTRSACRTLFFTCFVDYCSHIGTVYFWLSDIMWVFSLFFNLTLFFYHSELCWSTNADNHRCRVNLFLASARTGRIFERVSWRDTQSVTSSFFNRSDFVTGPLPDSRLLFFFISRLASTFNQARP